MGASPKAEKLSYLSDHRARPRQRGALGQVQRNGGGYGGRGQRNEQTLVSALQELTVCWRGQTRNSDISPHHKWHLSGAYPVACVVLPAYIQSVRQSSQGSLAVIIIRYKIMI